MDSPGLLLKTRLSEAVLVWLFQLRLRRRIFVAVDTTDSCKSERKQVEGLLNILVDAMQVDDACSLWVLGQKDKVYEFSMNSDRPLSRRQIAQEMIGSLRSVRTGTWLRETLQAMADVNAGATLPRDQGFFLVASDGEIFDAESVDFGGLRETPVGFVQVGERSCSQLEFMRKNSVMVEATPSSLKQFLTHRPLLVKIEDGWKGEHVRRFSPEGDLLPQEDGPFCIEGGGEVSWSDHGQ